MIELTPEQSLIVSSTSQSSSSLMVEAYAGTAKTTTIQAAAPGLRVPTLALAFNKKIADELRGKLPDHFQVKTMNGLGHAAWLRANPQILKPNLDDRKLGKLVTALAKDRRIKLASQQWDDTRRLVSAAMSAGLTPSNEGSPLIPDTQDSWRSLYESDADDFPFIYDLAYQTLTTSIQLARQGQLSFDDQIYCSTCLGGRFGQFPAVVVDEAQDLSSMNHLMVANSLSPDARLFAFGDTRQAIYAFRGASSQSMSAMRALRPQDSWEDMSLTVTFRCPKVIVERQQSHAPGFTAFHSNLEGQFQILPRDLTGKGWLLDSLKALLPEARLPITVLCRNNAPLISLAFKLIRSSIGCSMLGRDLGRGLINLTNKLSPSDSTPILQFVTKLEAWHEHETSLARVNDQLHKIELIDDKYESLIATIEACQAQTTGDLTAMLGKLFSSEGKQVLLSSCHRAKGLEWDLVVHLDPWRLPSKQAKIAEANGDPIPMEQERNLKYVAETRTRNTLVNADLEDFQS